MILPIMTYDTVINLFKDILVWNLALYLFLLGLWLTRMAPSISNNLMHKDDENFENQILVLFSTIISNIWIKSVGKAKLIFFSHKFI